MADDLGRTIHTRIGLTVATMEDTKVEPHVEFTPGATIERTTCNQSRWVGAPRCRWTYPDRLLEGEQFYQLKVLVGNEASADVFIDIPTQTMDMSTYQPLVTAYQAVMHWPAEGVTRVSHNRWQIPDDGIEFTELKPVT
jgi:hypothetical protein